MTQSRPIMANEIKKLMKETKVIEVKDFIKVSEILPYLTKLTIPANQKISQKIERDGEAAAASLLYAEVTRNTTVLFPQLVAALKKTAQNDVYATFKSAIHNLKKKKGTNANIAEAVQKLLDMIKDEESEKKCDQDSSDSESTHSDLLLEDIDKHNDATATETEAARRPIMSRGKPMTAFAPRTKSLPVGKSRPIVSQELAKKAISSMQASVFHQLANYLEEKVESGEMMWSYLVKNSSILKLTRKDQVDIESQLEQGKLFLDLLERKGHDIDKLETVFVENRLQKALTIIGSCKGVADKQDVELTKPHHPPADAPAQEWNWKLPSIVHVLLIMCLSVFCLVGLWSIVKACVYDGGYTQGPITTHICTHVYIHIGQHASNGSQYSNCI
ncbi:uncharacterized protein LOC128238856 [Mya arenaria]|uniref:uncharacterized protein LOC128238856 n=1 Tax=Mya arenaria TaxID=6604 RepID=UPI0022E8CAA4|nr:uncharacterized protein LOC128238856 [Mya arenaria]